MGKDYTMAATACQWLSIIAVPLLAYFGYLGHVNSPLLEIPADKKAGAAIGCWGAAALYAVTLVLSVSYKASRSPEVAANPNDYYMKGFA